MKKFLGIKKKDETSGQPAPPPPPPRAEGPSSSYSSSRNLDESGYNAEGSGRNIPQQQNDNNPEITDFPSDEVLAAKLRDFYLIHDAKKANDLDKIIAAAKKNGIKWLQDGLQRKYNGATIDFGDSAEYSNGGQDAEMEPEVDEPPPPKPPPPPPAKAPPAPPPPAPAAVRPMVVPPPMHNVGGGGGNNMFISAQPPPNFMGEAHAVAYPNAATALKSKGLGKYVKQLEERGIVNYEDLATLEESPNDPLWMSMPPIPDRKNLRTLVQTVKDYVASASFLGEAPSPSAAAATNVASPRSTSTPFDDHPELVEETQAASPQAAAIPIPFAPPQRAPVPQFAPPPPPKHFGEETTTEDVEDTSNLAEEEEEARRLEQEENDRQARLEAEEAQRKKREAEEKRRLEEEQQRKRKETAVSAPPPPPPAKSHAPPPPPAKTVPPPPAAAAAAAMKRKHSAESQMVPTAQMEDAERVVAELKDKLDDQNSLCEKLVSKAEELAKQLEEVQAEAERENEKLEKITAEFEAAQAKLASLRAKQKAAAAAAQPSPPVVVARNDSLEEQAAAEVEEGGGQEYEEQDSGMLKAAPPPPLPAPGAAKLERSSSGNKLTRVESTKSVSSTEGEPRATVLSGGSHHGGSAAAEIAQEASLAKLRPSTTTREKTAEPCNHYEVDLKATEFGQCVCGHKRSEHKAGGTSPAGAGSGRFAPGRASITKEHSSFRDNAAATSPSAVMASEHASPGKTENPYAAKGMYPALEPCDNFQVDLSASAFGMCQCGHLKQHHKLTSPTSSSANIREMPKLRSSRTIGESELPQVPVARTSGDSNSGTFPKPAGAGMDAPVPPASAAAASGTKPPPPARRPSALGGANSNRQLAAAAPPAPAEEKKPAPPSEEAQPPQAKETNGADAGPDHRSRLIGFYTKYNPEKLSEVDTILAKFKGKELVMFKKLKEKYPDAEI